MGKFSSFVKGLVIGGGIALLLSPKTGKDLRKDLAEKADDAMDKVMDYTETAMEKGAVVADAAKEASENVKTSRFDTVDTAKEGAKAKVDQFKENMKKAEVTAEALQTRFDAEIEPEFAVAEDIDPIEEGLKTL